MSNFIALTPVTTRQIYEQVCAQIIGLIVQGVWQPGFRLPSERDLATQLAVSRPTIREAIAALNTREVIQTRAGAGSYVAEVPVERLVALAREFGHDHGADAGLHLGSVADVSPVALLEVREVLEPAMCSLAAERYHATEDLLEYLRIMELPFDPENPEDRARWSETDRLFHREFAIITGNPVYIAIANLVSDVMDQPLWQRLRDDGLQLPGRQREHAEQHRRIAESVMSRDAELSRIHARRHVVSVRANMELDAGGES